MKKTFCRRHGLALLGFFLWCVSVAQSDILYLERFDGPASPVTLDALAPDIRPGNEQWVAANSFNADGTCKTANATAWLPCHFEEDRVYTISLKVDFPYQTGVSTVTGIAFTSASNFTTGTAKSAETHGYLELRRTGSWSFYAVGNGAEVTGGANNALFSSAQTDYPLQLVLTTSSSTAWKLDAFLGGVQQDLAPADVDSLSYTFSTPPALTGIGLTVTSSTYTLKEFAVEGPRPALATESASRLIDVFLLAGQSNMSGRASTGYTTDSRDAKALYYYRTDGPASTDLDSGGAFTTVQPLETGYYGPEITLTRSLADKGYRVAIIKVSDGGRSLDTDWNSANYGIWWKHWRSEVAHALRELEIMGYVIRLRGFLWLQGETDATHATRAANYAVNFTELLENVDATLRSLGYDPSAMQKLCALIRTGSGNYAETVRAAQQAVIEGIENAAWFDTDDLTVQSDNLHYDASGIQAIGERFAEAFPVIEKYSDWARERGLSGDDALPDADADGNGFDNLSEYALGLEPGGSLPLAMTLSDNSLSLATPLLRQDILYQAQWSEDLRHWYSDEILVERRPSSVVSQKSFSDLGRLFMRLDLVLESSDL